MEQPAALLENDPRLVEFSQGSLELLPRADVYRPGGSVVRGIARHAMFYRPPGRSPDGDEGESQWDVEVRMRECIDELLRPVAGAEGECVTIALFSHGIAIRSLVRGVIGADAKFVVHSETANTAISELRYTPGTGDLDGWRLVRFNDAAHLSP